MDEVVKEPVLGGSEPVESVAAPFDAEMKAAGQETSPTWELELFLSGAFVFSSFQIPGLIESAFKHLEPQMSDMGLLVLFDAVLYAKAIAFTLIVTFTLHLVARAYWVALLGIYSVFPGGVRWGEMKIGPLARELYRKRVPPLNDSIARLDNFCSIVFSAGLLVTVLFVYSTFLAALVSGLAFGLALAFSHGNGVAYYLLGNFLVFICIPLVAMQVDKKVGASLSPQSNGYRALRALILIAFSINLMRLTGPMMWTLATNIGRRKASAFLGVVMMSLMFLSAVDRLIQSDRLSFNSFDFIAASREHEVRYQAYENQRDPDENYLRTPSIQADIIRDPYVKLFVPYSPPRHNAWMARACPKLKPIQDRGIQLGADKPLPDSVVVPVLQCLARMHAVSLDGVPLPDLQFSFYEHPHTGVKGMIAYIPLEGVSNGRHVVGVMPAQPVDLPTDSASLANATWKQPTLIPFWR